MASCAALDFQAQRLARLESTLTTTEASAQALLAACAAPFVTEALADARPNPGGALNATSALLSRIDTLVSTLQSAGDALLREEAVETAPVTQQRGGAGFASLPQAVALRIFAALPADLRARCSAVCRGWRLLLLQSGAWLQLDLSKRSGVTRPVNDALLLAASARARGQLQTLNLDGIGLSVETAQQVVQANGASLRELSWLEYCHTVTDVDAWLSAASSLRSVRADIQASVEDAMRLLRNEAPYTLLQMRVVCVCDSAAAPPTELYAALRAHVSLRELYLQGVILDAQAMDALVDTVLATAELHCLLLGYCGLSAASVGALTRLLRNSKGLIELLIENHADDAVLLNAAAGAELAAALAANTTLQQLALENVKLWAIEDAAASVLRAVTGHPSLVGLYLSDNGVGDAAAHAGAQLAAVVASNSPVLTELNIGGIGFGDVGMAPLMDALPQNTHLRKLHCGRMGISAKFARTRFLPAIRANTSLRMLSAIDDLTPGFHGYRARAVLLEAEALVAARAAADTAA